MPRHLEPTGMYRSYDKRPNGASNAPWKGGKVLVWDATCRDMMAASYAALASSGAGAAAELWEE